MQAARTAQPYMSPYLAGLGIGIVLLLAYVIMGRGLEAFSSAVSAAVRRSYRRAPRRALVAARRPRLSPSPASFAAAVEGRFCDPRAAEHAFAAWRDQNFTAKAT